MILFSFYKKTSFQSIVERGFEFFQKNLIYKEKCAFTKLESVKNVMKTIWVNKIWRQFYSRALVLALLC